MRFSTRCLSLVLVVSSACSIPPAETGRGVALPEVSATNGYEQGVSAPFAGVLDRYVVVAGGCNFPETPAAQGGPKRFYSDIHLFDARAGQWHTAGSLPQAVAYGASASTPEGVICAGGTTPEGVSRSVWMLGLSADSVTITPLPPLPEPLDNCAGACLDEQFYVVGGTTLYAYDLRTGQWQEQAPLPEKRIQPTLAAQNGQLWLFGGYDPDGPQYVSGTGYTYDPATDTWRSVTGPTDRTGRPLLAAGGNASAWGRDTIVCFGGVDSEIFTEALKRSAALAIDPRNDSLQQAQRQYMEQPPQWYRFNNRVLIYNTKSDRWNVADTASSSARAGAGLTLLPHQEGLLLFNGELKPGIRTPEVWCWQP